MNQDFQDNEQPRPPEQPAPSQPETQNTLLAIKQEIVDYLLNDEKTNKFVQAVEKLRTMAIKMTRAEDWVRFGKTLHLQDKRTAELNTFLQTIYGVNVTVMKPTLQKEAFKGWTTVKDAATGKETEIEIDVIEYIYTGGAVIEEVAEREGKIRRVRTIEPITGSCRTDDKLFAKRHGQFLDPAHIPPSLVIKKADANYRGNVYRYIWGLKAISDEQLTAAGLDIKKVIDSSVRGADQAVTPEQKQGLDALWQRILAVHNQKPELARAFLKKMTAYQSYVSKKTGETVPASEGYTDIARLKPGFTYDKIVKAVEDMEAHNHA